MIKQFILNFIANRFKEHTTMANLLSALVSATFVGLATGEPIGGAIAASLHLANALVPDKTKSAIKTIEAEEIK